MLGNAGIAVLYLFGDDDATPIAPGSPRTILAGNTSVTFRLVPTPLDAPLEIPPARAGGFDPALEAAFVPSPARDAALARLREPGALAVTSGQQPGLFTGPLDTVHKALSTAALASVLERRRGRPGRSVFRIALDDHDFTEASTTAWLTADGSLESATLPPRPPEAPLTPMYRQPLGEGVGSALEALASSLRPPNSGTKTLALLSSSLPLRRHRGGGVPRARWRSCSPRPAIPVLRQHPCGDRAGCGAARPARPGARRGDRRCPRAGGGVSGRERPDFGRRPGRWRGPAEAFGVSRAAIAWWPPKVGSSPVAGRSGSHLSTSSDGSPRPIPRRLSPNVLLRPVVESGAAPDRRLPRAVGVSCAISG